MQINLRGNRVAIQKNKKATAEVGNLGIVVPGGEEYTGIIKYVGPEVTELKVGQKVYFTTNHQQVRIGADELCLMEEKEVYATVTGE